MNINLKGLMAVGAIGFGLSAVNASASTGLPENLESQPSRLAAQDSSIERAKKACIAVGVPEVNSMFVQEFNQTRGLHRYNWNTATDAELQTLVRDFMSNGYITIKKPLDFSRDVVREDTAGESALERARRVCANPNVPEKLLTRAVMSIGDRAYNMSSVQLRDAIDDEL